VSQAKPFIDYDGPTGAYIALGDRMLSLENPEAMAALGHSGMLISLGRNPEAKQFAQKLGRQPTLTH
jgi:hypothetical protein